MLQIKKTVHTGLEPMYPLRNVSYFSLYLRYIQTKFLNVNCFLVTCIFMYFKMGKCFYNF